jgi:hypothetical protein
VETSRVFVPAAESLLLLRQKLDFVHFCHARG